MPTSFPHRHQMIERAVSRAPDAQSDANVALWHSLATELSTLIGERGFRSLYHRSLYCVSVKFPWMAPLMAQVPAGAFNAVEFRLSPSDPGEAQAAHVALLKNFTDTLIVLIGESMTNNILRQAWGDDVVDHAGTESRS